MKRILSFASLVLFTVCMFAVPAQRRPFQAKLADGSPVTVCLTGDEFYHAYVDEEGHELVRLADGRFSRVQSPWLSAARRIGAQQRRMMAYERRMRRAEVARKAGTFKGTKRGLVILVSFADVKMQEKHTREVFDAMFNEEGYSDNGHVGSVRDYFKAQSYGQFEIDFDVVGPYTLEYGMKYYGENDPRQDNADMRVGTMAAEAVRLADNDVNYKNYDWDGDGEVDQVFVVYAGYGEASGEGLADCIWPVEWWLSSSDYGRSLRMDGVLVDQFACSGELHGNKGTELGGIGTACHEFSHCLGLPDFYDTSGGTNFGLNLWSVMDYGCYNGTIDAQGYTHANIPCGYTSYERMACGWLEPTELAEGRTVRGMKALVEAPEAYIVYNDANRNEYYLLENRQLTSWDSGLGAHGMLVIHVDYSASVWEDNTVNADRKHQRCTIIAADNSYYPTAKDIAGDPYPGTSKNTSLTDTSKPAATLYNNAPDGRQLMGKPIEEIKEADGLISFIAMGGDAGTLRTPNAEAATDVKEHSFTAHWSRVPKATSYTLAVTSGDADPVYYESIPDTFLVVAGLDSTVVHTYSVKAFAFGRESGWSNVVTVKLKGFGEWTDWEPYGDGTAVYRYSSTGAYADYGSKSYPIFVRTSNQNPALHQFRLYGWGSNMTLDIDYDSSTGHCSVAQQYIGYTDSERGKVYVADQVYWYNNVLGYSAAWSSFPSKFDTSTGVITLYVAYYDLYDNREYWGEGVETVTVSGSTFKDYSIEVTLGALQENEDGTGMQNVTVTPGSSVAYWRYAVIEKELTDDSAVISDLINDVTQGNISSTYAEGPQQFSVTVSGGKYSLLAVSYDESGNSKRYAFKNFRFSSSREWTVLGTARYTDDVLSPLFSGYDMVTYDVEVQERTDRPGFFRMKNPYGLGHPYNSPEEVLEGDYYIEIDATDPQAVSIPLQEMGVDWGYGPCKMLSMPDAAYRGKFENSVITFPTPHSISIMMGENMYKTNTSGGFRLDLTTCGISSPQDEGAGSQSSGSRLFDLQGRPVATPQAGGLYIRNGRKMLVR